MPKVISKIICGDCLEVLPALPKATVIFADPPDNRKISYLGFDDHRSDYFGWLRSIINLATGRADIFWLSYFHRYGPAVLGSAPYLPAPWSIRQFIWRFTFGQHNNHDCGNGYRPLLRVMAPGAQLYPDAIRVPSKRLEKYKDKRANPAGRVPDDVWEFPRVCGTFTERRPWHPNQHPEALMERLLKLSAKPGDLVIDLFSGTGTTLRVCDRLGLSCIGIEISRPYCDHIAEETGAEMEVFHGN